MSDEITLRDTFAAAALTGLISDADYEYSPDTAAQDAYACADAMLRERARNGAPAGRETVQHTLTDAEREALEWSIKECEREAVIERSRATTGNYLNCGLRECQAWSRADTLRNLLARLGGDA